VVLSKRRAGHVDSFRSRDRPKPSRQESAIPKYGFEHDKLERLAGIEATWDRGTRTHLEMNCHAFSPGPTQGRRYIAVKMQRALDSPIGLPSRSTSASWMLVFLMPADVLDRVLRLRADEKAGFRRIGVNRDFAAGRGEKIEETILRPD